MRALIAAFVLAACGGSPKPPPVENKPTAPVPAPVASPAAAEWIRKLDDPRERERAIEKLEQLGDPSAIEPLTKVWREDQSAYALRVIVSLAGKSNWSRAEPVLVEALGAMDETNPRTVDSATIAADALGEAKRPVVAPLAAVAARPPNSRTITAQLAATRALGKIPDNSAMAALTALIDREPPPHPFTATAKDDVRAMGDHYGLFLAVTGSAIDAINDRHGDASKSLLLAIYRVPELAAPIRRAYVGSGPQWTTLIDVLGGKHPGVERLFKDKRYAQYCIPQCVPVAARDYYAAILLGDFYNPVAVPALLAALKRPALPAYYLDGDPGPTQHTAIFDALRKIGAPDAAAPLYAMWHDGKVRLDVRIGALTAYGFVARDASAAAELSAIAGDNRADDGLRQAAALVLAQLSANPDDIATFTKLAKRYLDASAKKRKEADGKPKANADAADAKLAIVKQAFDNAKATLLAVTQDAKATVDQIKAATVAAQQAEDNYKVAKKAHKQAVADYKDLDRDSKGYLGFARMFQTHVARVAIAIRCKDDAACYATSLTLTPETIPAQLTAYLPDVATWTVNDRLGLVEATIERAMLELGKRGMKASGTVDALLDRVGSDDRIIRQSILLALPKIAKLPCDRCVAKLDAAIVAGTAKTSLGELVFETQILRNYFSWAGGRVPH